jgi:two-component system NtrC family sensor kinase
MLVRPSFAAGASEAPTPTDVPSRPAKAFWPLWLASVLLPLAAFAGGAWWSWRAVEADTRARLVRAVEVQREHALRVFETQEAILAALQARTRGMNWDSIASSRELHAFMRQVDESAPGTSGAGIVAPDGRLVQLSGPAFPAPPLDLSSRDYVQAQRTARVGSTAYVGETMLSGVTRRLLFALSKPTLDGDGSPDGGAVWATVRPADLQAFYATLMEGNVDAALLIRTDGVILARHPPVDPLVGRRLSAGSAMMELVTQAAGTDDEVVAETTSLVDGARRLYAMRRVNGYPVVVAYGLHASGPRAAWLRYLAAIGAIAASMSLALLWLTWRVQGQAKREAAALERERDALQAARMEAERRADAEAAMRQGQRLEALGQLTAGVAHDFRNVVQAVQGGARLIQQAVERDPTRIHGLAEMVAEAAGRGANLTNRMLDFARGQGADGAGVAEPRQAVEGACGILKAALGGKYRLRCELADDLPALVRGVRAELEAALMNLAINARDAMPEGGEIFVSAKLVRDPSSLPPGGYVEITVSDTGAGMDAATLARATQAFFTTKPPGQGTGLGLATVRAFSEGAGGALHIASEAGRGTRVTFWLPTAAT